MTVYIVCDFDVHQRENVILDVYSDRQLAEARLATSTWTNDTGEVHSHFWIEEFELIETPKTCIWCNGNHDAKDCWSDPAHLAMRP